MPSKKKLLTSAIALGAAAALTLGGTFAWQSINQTALNEASDIVNPGGRLHVDMNYNGAMNTNSDIYVENFTEADNGGQDIFARIRLEEYMEIVMNYDDPDLETVEVVAGSKTLKDGVADDTDNTLTDDSATRTDKFDYAYAIHYFGLSDEEKVAGTENNTAYTYWKWNPGTASSHEGLYFMPTFNLNKDSLVADINGTYYDTLGGISNRGVSQYDYTEWKDGDKRTATEIYDGDVDTLDELQAPAIVNDLIENGSKSEYAPTYKDDIVLVEGEEHTAAQVGETHGLISIEEWITKLTEGGGTYDEATMGGYWVYDEDGWVYWSSPIEPGECTGLLLDSFDLTDIMDDTWYYAINVVGQFITADDIGKEDGTGFYDRDGGTAPSRKALALLTAIGVEVDEVVHVAQLRENENLMVVSMAYADTLSLTNSSNEIPSELDVILMSAALADAAELTKDVDYTFEGGYFNFLDSGVVPEGAVLQISGDGGAMFLLVDVDDTLTIPAEKTETMDGVVSTVGAGIPVRMAETGKAPEGSFLLSAVDLTTTDPVDLTAADYVYEDGTITFVNSDLGNCLVMFQMAADDRFGLIYLTDNEVISNAEPLTLFSVSGGAMAASGTLETGSYYGGWESGSTYVVSGIPHDEGETLTWKLYEHGTTTAANTGKIGFVTDDGLSAVSLDDTAARTKNTTTSAARPTLTIRVTKDVTEKDWYSLVGTTAGGAEKYRFGIYFGEKDPTVVTGLSGWGWKNGTKTLPIDDNGKSTYITDAYYNNIGDLVPYATNGMNSYGDELTLDVSGASCVFSNYSSSGKDYYAMAGEGSYSVYTTKSKMLLMASDNGTIIVDESAMDHADYGQLSDAVLTVDVTMTCGEVTETRTLELTVRSFLNSMPDRDDVIVLGSGSTSNPITISSNTYYYMIKKDDYKNSWLAENDDPIGAGSCMANLFNDRSNLGNLSGGNYTEATTDSSGDWVPMSGGSTLGTFSVDAKYGYLKFMAYDSGYGWEIGLRYADGGLTYLWVE